MQMLTTFFYLGNVGVFTNIFTVQKFLVGEKIPTRV
jgi:hypothetical protein